MRHPKVHHIREFINRGQNIVGNNIVLDKETVTNMAKELADLLAHLLELQNQILDLKDQVDQNQVVEVELKGQDF